MLERRIGGVVLDKLSWLLYIDLKVIWEFHGEKNGRNISDSVTNYIYSLFFLFF